MSFDKDTLELFEEAVEALKFRTHASICCVRVRDIEETDAKTLERVTRDFAEVRALLIDFLNRRGLGTQARHLERWRGGEVSVLKEILGAAKVDPDAFK